MKNLNKGIQDNKKLASAQEVSTQQWIIDHLNQIPNPFPHLKNRAVKYSALMLGISIANSMVSEQTTSFITSLTNQVLMTKPVILWPILGANAEEIMEIENVQELLEREFSNPAEIEEILFNRYHPQSIYRRRTIEIEGEIDLSRFIKLKSFKISRGYDEKKLVIIKKMPLSLEELEINGFNHLQIEPELISSLIGLKKLDVKWLKLKELDLSKNFELTSLYCKFNELNKLDVSKNPKLEILVCNNNEITELNLSSNQIKEIDCEHNKITDLKFLTTISHPEKVSSLVLGNNNFPPQNLDIFSRFTNLKTLKIRDNPFFGSLEPLKNLDKLEELDISGTNIDKGLEYLSDSIEYFHCDSKHLPGSRVAKLQEQLRIFNYNIKKWRLANVPGYVEKEVRQEDVQPTIVFPSKVIEEVKSSVIYLESDTEKKTKDQYTLTDYYNLDYREEMIDNHFSLLWAWLGRLGEVPEIKKEVSQLHQEWEKYKQKEIVIQGEIGEQFWQVSNFNKESYEKWTKKREAFRERSNKYSRKVRKNSPYSLDWLEAREMIWKEIAACQNKFNSFCQIYQEAEEWLTKQKTNSLSSEFKKIENNFGELKKKEPRVLQLNFTDFLIITMMLRSYRKLRPKSLEELINFVHNNGAEKLEERSCDGETKIQQLEQQTEKQTEITKWNSIKNNMEGEKDINRLAEGGYWDREIQNLQNDKLPADKKKIALQTKRRNWFKQLKNKQTEQFQTRQEITPKKY